MDHLIIQARDAMRDALTNLPITGANAYLYSEVPFPELQLPLLAIEYQEDKADPKSLGFPALEELGPVFVVHILVKQEGDFEKAAFLIRNDVEQALLASVQGKTLGGLVQWLRRVGAECERDELPNNPVYRLSLQFQASIYHLESLPDSK